MKKEPPIIEFHGSLVIRKTHDDYIVHHLGRQGHSHHNTRKGAHKLCMILEAGLMPKDQYFRESARRILTPEEFAALETPNSKPPVIKRRNY